MRIGQNITIDEIHTEVELNILVDCISIIIIPSSTMSGMIRIAVLSRALLFTRNEYRLADLPLAPLNIN